MSFDTPLPIKPIGELIEETDWDKYGTGVNPKCADCMVHSGYEATAVDDTFKKPWKALKVFLKGPKYEGKMSPEVPFLYEDKSSGESESNTSAHRISCSSQVIERVDHA